MTKPFRRTFDQDEQSAKNSQAIPININLARAMVVFWEFGGSHRPSVAYRVEGYKMATMRETFVS